MKMLSFSNEGVCIFQTKDSMPYRFTEAHVIPWVEPPSQRGLVLQQELGTKTCLNQSVPGGRSVLFLCEFGVN